MENFILWLISIIVIICALYGFTISLENQKQLYILEERIEKLEEGESNGTR